MNNCFSFIGNLTSILSFLLTIFIYFTIERIKLDYQARATIPQLMDELLNLRKQIDELFIGKFFIENKNSIIEKSDLAEVDIRNLTSKFKGINFKQYKKEVEPYVNDFYSTKDTFESDQTKENARNMNRSLLLIIQSSRNFLADADWRRS